MPSHQNLFKEEGGGGEGGEEKKKSRIKPNKSFCSRTGVRGGSGVGWQGQISKTHFPVLYTSCLKWETEAREVQVRDIFKKTGSACVHKMICRRHGTQNAPKVKSF